MYDPEDDFESHEEQEKQLKSSLSRYEEMIRTRKRYFFDVDALVRMIDHYIDGGHYGKAGEVIEFASQLHPASANLVLKRAQLSALSGKYEKALTFLEDAEKLSPNDADIFLIKGNVYSSLERYDEAISCFNRALANAEERDEVFLCMGITYQNMHEYNRACEYFKRALRENPNCEPVYEQLTLCYTHTDQIEEGIRYFNSRIDGDPYSYLSWYSLGDLYTRLDLYEKALLAYDYSTLIREDFLPAYLDYAHVTALLGRYNESIERFKRTFEFAAPDAYTYFSIAECYEKLEQMELARVYYKKAGKLMPRLAEAWFGVAVTLEFEERWYEMLHFAKKALALEKDNSHYLVMVADAQYHLDNHGQAEVYYRRALETDPDNTDAWTAYVDFLASISRGDDALTMSREGAELHPGCEDLGYRLINNLYLNGRLKEAYDLLGESLQKNPSGIRTLFDVAPRLQHDQTVIRLMARYPSA